MKNKNLGKNIIMLYGFSIAKIVFPLLTLPYLTRILSVEAYGAVSYVKTVMTYMQLVIDFGFMLSGTKEIVLKKNNSEQLSQAVGDILIARLILCGMSFVALLLLSFFLPILRNNLAYTLMSFCPVVMTVFLFDYLFRGLERMQVITSRFILMKGFSTVLTFVLVKEDKDIMLIPILDIIGSIFAIVLVLIEIKKIGIRISFTGLKSAFVKLRESSIYFASNIATTVGGALSTLLIGAFLDASDIAYWSVAMQVINVALTLYSPIIDGIYPTLLKNRDYSVIKRMLTIFLPLITVGCVIVMLFSNIIVTTAFGDKYISSANILRGLIPVAFFAFPAQIIGWPMLGTIEKTKQVTITTIIYGTFNIVCLLVLIALGMFTLKNIIIVRVLSEFVLFLGRFVYCVIYRDMFKKQIPISYQETNT